MPDTDTTTVKDLWCATCGAYRGTTGHPWWHASSTCVQGPPVPHRPPFARVGLCHDTDTFTDD